MKNKTKFLIGGIICAVISSIYLYISLNKELYFISGVLGVLFITGLILIGIALED